MLYVKRLTHTAKLPTRATEGSAGLDLYADEETLIAAYGGQALVSTGIAVSIDPGKCGQIWPRSGLDVKGIGRGAGLIDSDYRGPVKVLLINRSGRAFPVQRGDRIAQLVITAAFPDAVIEVDELTDTARAARGFGSTGR